MNKYTVHFCRCGHIHFILREDFENAIHANKCLITVCTHCGEMHIEGADYVDSHDACGIEGADYDYWSTTTSTPQELTEFSYGKIPIYKIIFSSGKEVPMMNGFPADHYIRSCLSMSHAFYNTNSRGYSTDAAEEYRASSTIDFETLIKSLDNDELYSINDQYFGFIK